MTYNPKSSAPAVSNSQLRLLWKLSLFIYLVCNTAFASKTYLMMLNSYSMYLFLGVSILCIITSGVVKVNAYVLSLLSFVVVILFGCLYSTSDYASSTAYDYFVSMIIVFCIINFIDTDEDVKFIFKTLMIGGLVLDIYILSIYGTGFVDAILEQTRVGEVAGNVNDVGLKSCFAALIAMFFLIREENKTPKVFYTVICIVCSFFSIITASKKVLVLLLIGFFFLLFIGKRKKKNVLVMLRNILIAFMAAVVVLILIYNVKYFEYMRVRVDELFDMLLTGGGNSSDQKRVRFMTEGFLVFYQKPFFGDGTAASYNYFGTYSHSNFIEILMNHGLVGFVVHYACYPIAIYRCFKKRRADSGSDNLADLCLLVILSIQVLSIALVYYTFIYYQVLLAISATYVLKSMSQGKSLPSNKKEQVV